ncbi:hypothetical protein H5410_011590 [Solanum commersonii]|uniref:Uncharacterized protein n=1 Tax=Solanum commersonii TaxID=4109 RepID=A0A9J6APT5_SOLCO|nr:hypothetical protein H5410_011590 [Solanum commersonii]
MGEVEAYPALLPPLQSEEGFSFRFEPVPSPDKGGGFIVSIKKSSRILDTKPSWRMLVQL